MTAKLVGLVTLRSFPTFKLALICVGIFIRPSAFECNGRICRFRLQFRRVVAYLRNAAVPVISAFLVRGENKRVTNAGAESSLPLSANTAISTRLFFIPAYTAPGLVYAISPRSQRRFQHRQAVFTDTKSGLPRRIRQ